MPLKTYKTKEEVPEAQRDAAIALADGTFGVVEEVDTTQFQSDATELKRKLEAAERASKRIAADLLAARAEKEGVTGEALAKIRADAKAEYIGEVQAELDRGRAAVAENRALKLDNKVKTFAASSGVRAERLTAWWKLHGDKFDLTDDGTPIVKDKPGVTVEKYIAGVCKDETPEFYVGSQASGGGAAGSSSAGSTNGAPRIDVLANPSAALAAARLAGRTE